MLRYKSRVGDRLTPNEKGYYVALASLSKE